MFQKIIIIISMIFTNIYLLAPRAYCAFPPLTDTLLNNTTYYYHDGLGVLVKDGEYEEYKVSPVVGKHLICGIYIRDIVHGDLDADGNEDAGVLYTYSGGGSGIFKYLLAILNDNGNPKHVSKTPLGDRTKIEDFYFENNSIIVQAIVHGEDDPLCCPTERKLMKYTLKNDTLAVDVTPLGKINDQDKGMPSAWDATQKSNSIEAYQEFIRKYPQSSFSGEAKTTVRKLEEKAKEAKVKEDFERFLAAIDAGDFDAVRRFLEIHPDFVHRKGDFGWRALHHAAKEGYYRQVTTINNEITVKILPPSGGSLADASKKIANLLLSKNAEIEAIDETFGTALLTASEFGSITMVKFLLSKGANINATNSFGQTPLLLAARMGYTNIVAFLLSSGAHTDTVDGFGKTPLDHAIQGDKELPKGNKDVIRLLKEKISR